MQCDKIRTGKGFGHVGADSRTPSDSHQRFYMENERCNFDLFLLCLQHLVGGCVTLTEPTGASALAVLDGIHTVEVQYGAAIGEEPQ